MLFTQQVVHSLNRVECAERYFNEDSRPVAHCTVPQTRKFESLQFLSTLRLVRNETCSLVYIVHQVELVTLIVANCTNQIYWIEVSTVFEHCLLFRIVHVDL